MCECDTLTAATHHTPVVDATWDGPGNERRLPSPLPVSVARRVFAWVDPDRVDADGNVPKDAGRLIHHMVSADGIPGPANLRGMAAAIAALHGGRGKGPGMDVQIPPEGRRGAYTHLSVHYRDDNREPPPFEMNAETASYWLTAATPVEGRPVTAYTNPGFAGPVPLTVDSNGVVRGHAWTWDQCHTGYGDQCVTPPRDQGVYPYFATGATLLADGGTVRTGVLVGGADHAPEDLGAKAAAGWYGDVTTAWARVAIGDDDHGGWVSGETFDDVDPGLLARTAGAPLSGDWRRIDGGLKLIALLSVNTPGFPIVASAADGTPKTVIAAISPSARHRIRAVRLKAVLRDERKRRLSDEVARTAAPGGRPRNRPEEGRRAWGHRQGQPA